MVRMQYIFSSMLIVTPTNGFVQPVAALARHSPCNVTRDTWDADSHKQATEIYDSTNMDVVLYVNVGLLVRE